MSSTFVKPVVIETNSGEFQQVLVPMNLAKGSEGNLRAKFSLKAQQTFFETAIEDRQNGNLYVGSSEKGEVQLDNSNGFQALIGRFFSVTIDPVLFPSKHGNDSVEGRYSAVQWNCGREPGAAVLAVDRDGEILLLRSFRHAVRDKKVLGERVAGWRTELARGGRRPQESLRGCAVREATEELGLVKLLEGPTSLGFVEPDTGILSSRVEIFLIKGDFQQEASNRDVSESTLSTVKMSVPEVFDAIDNGAIFDSFVEVALSRALRKNLI